MQMTVSGALRNVQWYGRGPQENYWDRNLGGLVSHKEMQLEPACSASHSWRLDVDDINRMARYWLDGWDEAAA